MVSLAVNIHLCVYTYLCARIELAGGGPGGVRGEVQGEKVGVK